MLSLPFMSLHDFRSYMLHTGAADLSWIPVYICWKVSNMKHRARCSKVTPILLPLRPIWAAQLSTSSLKRQLRGCHVLISQTMTDVQTENLSQQNTSCKMYNHHCILNRWFVYKNPNHLIEPPVFILQRLYTDWTCWLLPGEIVLL